MLEIVIWDENAERIQNCHANLSQALKSLSMNARIICQSEPPLLSRMGLTGRCPTVEVNGNYWRRNIGEVVSVEHFLSLLKQI